jgi:hypothetical protein
VAGINWYGNGDEPLPMRINGRDWMVIGAGDAGRLRGGHAVCLRPWDVVDSPGWWPYYNQGQEGRCTEFAELRALSLLNRKRYDLTSRWHYWTAQRDDEWPGGSYPDANPRYEGTSVRAALDVLRTYGAVPAKRYPVDYLGAPRLVRPDEGIAAYRWATDWSQVREALRVPDDLPGVPMLNSWGKDYPRETLLLDGFGARLLSEDGEFGVITDR